MGHRRSSSCGNQAYARTDRYINDALADQLPVNAGSKSIEVYFVPETDERTILSVDWRTHKFGTSAAITNGRHHSAGLRIRKLPVRIENFIA
jgi:hypothetical protein